MERRINYRSAWKTEVVLSCENFGLIRGTTRDISRRGVFVETGNALVGDNISVDVCFMLKKDERNDVQSFAAQVVRVDRKGVGIQFNADVSSEFLCYT